VVVAILDTGVDYTHPDLGGCKGFGCKVKDGYDIVNDDRDPMDNDGHGTMVAGIIAANGVLKGVAPDAELLVYKVLEPSEDGPASGDTSDVIDGIQKAIKDEADIICMSLGGGR
jgi:subtilisin family serine protease